MKDIRRFHLAQEEFDDYNIALKEIKNGRKESHWIWFIFPQLEILSRSDISVYYGISGLEEAKAFLKDKTLNFRLREITSELLKHKGKDIRQIMGGLDAMKLRSSMTLFDIASLHDIFEEVLDTFYDGTRCMVTMTACGR
jgi:uncharacterized protein (DUF1810 family)